MDAAQYCYHCGGELAEGVLPFILPTDTAPATPRHWRSTGAAVIPGSIAKAPSSSPPYPPRASVVLPCRPRYRTAS
jgi:hypothetical protein